MSDPTDTEAGATDVTKREGGEKSARHDVMPAYLDRGTPIGRYVVLERLGEGGMGVVYSAFDPELDRKVAVKLLQGKSGGDASQVSGDQAWLLREAQALARLSHPNVVSVHDVGTLPGDRVFVAMELVDGVTLRKWMKAEVRPWRDVLPVMIAAGQGLAAAHAAGLVHRDFKPDNVLVGHDGRVRVMDFGLAKVRPGIDSGPVPRISASELNIEAKSPLTDSLTVAGTVLGTPAYMAPELYAGGTADAASDQFSFGVALFEALFGARPFVKEQLVPTRPEPPKPKLPDGTKVPARIQRTVLRAIAIDPAQRFPSMAALLDELGNDPNAARRRTVLALGLGAVVLAGGGGVYIAVTRAAPEPCKGIDQRLAGVWDPALKQKVRAGFMATKRSYAAQAFAQVERSFDAYAQEWVATATDSCRATRVRRDQTEEVLSLRQLCLDQRLAELGALAQALVDPHPLILDKADKLARELEPLAACSNVAALRAPDQPTPEQRAQIEGPSKQLAEAKAQLIAGKYLPALVSSQKAVDTAVKLNYLPLLAEASAIRGAALVSTGNFVDGATAYTQAVWTGMRGKRDDVVAGAALANAMLAAEARGKPSEAMIWLELGEASARRVGLERVMGARFGMVRGLVAALAGDYPTAIAQHEKSFAAAERQFGKDNPALWADELLLATTLTRGLAYARALPHYEHARAVREKMVGPDHPDIALTLSNSGICYMHLGDYKKAREVYERALAIREKTYGKQSPLIVGTLINFAELIAKSDPATALPMIERALVLAKQLPGVEHPTYHEGATTYIDVLWRAGRAAEGRKVSEDTFAIERRVKSVTLPGTLTVRAELELAQRAWADAARFAEEAIKIFEEHSGENPELWRPLFALAAAKLGLGDRAAAKVVVERALAIAENAGIGDYHLAELRTLHARTK
ncbi:MAG TPA: serine/threonine-protein kinase [Kofleriaceae bacterium]